MVSNSVVIDPAEGKAFVLTFAAHGNTGEDRATPRIYDYVAPSNAIIVSVGGEFHEIVGRMKDGSNRLWRLAEVSEILVSVGQDVPAGAVIGRNAYYRDGVYRALHENEGTTRRLRFTAMVNTTKAQLAALQVPAALKPKQRKVRSTGAVNRRMGPGTHYAAFGTDLKPGTVGDFIAFAYGPASQGQPAGENGNFWYQGFTGAWFWGPAFENIDGTGLVDKTAEFADVVVVVPPAPEVPVVVPAPEEPTPIIIPAIPAEPEPTPEPVPDPVPDPTPAPEPETPPVIDPTPEEPAQPGPDPVPTQPAPTTKPVAGGLLAVVLALVGLVVAALTGLFQ